MIRHGLQRQQSRSGATLQLASGATRPPLCASISQGQFFQLLLADAESGPAAADEQQRLRDAALAVLAASKHQQLNTTLASFVTMQGMSQGAALIGKPVSYDPGNGQLVKGTVDSVAVDNTGAVTLSIGGKSVPLSQIRTISSIKTPGTGTATQPSS